MSFLRSYLAFILLLSSNLNPPFLLFEAGNEGPLVLLFEMFTFEIHALDSERMNELLKTPHIITSIFQGH